MAKKKEWCREEDTEKKYLFEFGWYSEISEMPDIGKNLYLRKAMKKYTNKGGEQWKVGKLYMRCPDCNRKLKKKFVLKGYGFMPDDFHYYSYLPAHKKKGK